MAGYVVIIDVNRKTEKMWITRKTGLKKRYQGKT